MNIHRETDAKPDIVNDVIVDNAPLTSRRTTVRPLSVIGPYV